MALPEWERAVHSPWGCPALAQRGRGWMEGWTGALYHTLCTGLSTSSVRARLLLHAGQELHCQHVPMGKALISFFSLVSPFS